VIDGLIDFAVVTASKVHAGAKSVLLRLEGVAGVGLPTEDVDDCETWGEAAVLARPADPTTDGKMEVLMLRGGDELIAIASKDRRWQISLEKGEVRIRAFGASAGYVHLTPSGAVYVTGRASGNVVVDVDAGQVQLGKATTPPEGVLNGQAIDPFTGSTHFVLGNASTKVLAQKV